MRLLISTFIFLCFSSLYAQRNCATMDVLAAQLQQNPALQQQMDAIEMHNHQYHQQLSNQVEFRNVITIPVVFHIVHNGDALGVNENLPESLILAQLSQLNQDFALLNADAGLIPGLFQPVAANTEIQFCLAQRKPDGTPTNGINRVQYAQASWTTGQVNSTLKPQTIWDRNQYLNVWSVVFGGTSSNVLGFAQFPGGNANTDGVVVAWNTVGSLAQPNPASTNYGKGRTLAHEVGHWLNLRHIWGDATCGNDFVDDTPVHQTSNSGCPAFPKTNNCAGGPWTEMTMNYMDYTFDACMYMFTVGQKNRMRAVLNPGGFRFSLNSSLGCVPPGPVCNAPAAAQLSVSNITATSARLNCAVTGVNAYDWRYRAVGASTWTELPSTTANFTDIGGLAPSTTHEFQVMVLCGELWSAWSASLTFTTGAFVCDAPAVSQISVSNITTSSARLQCSVTGVDAYDWRYRQTGASNWTDLPSTTTPFTDVSGLSASTSYEFQVMVLCGTVWSAWSPALGFTTPAPAPCVAPFLGSFSATEITATSARFNCSVTGVSAYLWRYRVQGAVQWTVLPATTENFVYVYDLLPQTSYEMQVAVICQGNTSDWSKSLFFITESGGPVCVAPALNQIGASNISETAATLNCSVTGVSAYHWRYRAVGNTTWTDLPSTPAGSTVLSSLSPATAYEFQVAVMCASGLSAWSPAQTFSTNASATCSAPDAAQLSVSFVTTSSAQLNCSLAGASSYAWRYRQTGTSAWTNLPSTTGNFTAVSGLNPSTGYEFQVSVLCANGIVSDWSVSQTFTTIQDTCDPPALSQIFATNITTTSVRLNCTVTGVSAYQWQYRVTGASAWIDLGTTGVNFVDLTGLSASTLYEFQVAVQCGAVTSAWSATQIFTTHASSPSCFAPSTRSLSVTNITGASARLNCSVPGVSFYHWRYRLLGTSIWITPAPTTVNFTDISGLQSSSAYEFQSAVDCANTMSDWSGSFVFFTSSSVRMDPSTETALQLFPVPAREYVQVQYRIPAAAEVVATVMDMSGKVIAVEKWGRAEAGAHTRVLSTEHLLAGIYVLQIRADENICREMFIIAAN